MQVPFFSLQTLHRQIREAFLAKMNVLLQKGDFILGEAVSEFEKEYAHSSGTNYCKGISNGLDALKISLKSLGIGEADEVIVSAHTYIASIFAVLETGAKPVFVEPANDSFNISVATISKAISANTKAILPVHLYGEPCAMDEIISLAEMKSLKVVEDNAQAQGARYKGKKAGSFGHVNATSFYPSKNLGAMGDAGAVTTNDESIARQIRVLRNVDSEKKYYHEVRGYNARLDTVHATFLSCKLPCLGVWNKERRNVAHRYLNNLKDCSSVVLPKQSDDTEQVYHLFVIRLKHRDALQQYLSEHQIQTLIHYPMPRQLQPALRHLGYAKGDFPFTEEISNTCLSLPLFTGITNEQIDFVSEKILNFEKR